MRCPFLNHMDIRGRRLPAAPAFSCGYRDHPAEHPFSLLGRGASKPPGKNGDALLVPSGSIADSFQMQRKWLRGSSPLLRLTLLTAARGPLKVPLGVILSVPWAKLLSCEDFLCLHLRGPHSVLLTLALRHPRVSVALAPFLPSYCPLSAPSAPAGLG